MIRERVAEEVYLFTSEVYAKVNAGAVVGADWSVMIDTLAYPEETLEIRDFLEKRIHKPVRYLINTHYHADHSLGNSWFPNAVIVAHQRCRELLDTLGRTALNNAQQQSKELEDVRIVLPDAVFDRGGISIRVGKRTLQLVFLPGHSPDGIGVLIEEDRVLFSGDIMMPIPYIIDGDYDTMIESLNKIPGMKLENLIQGHGEVVLRGEVRSKVEANIEYLDQLRRHVRKASRRREPEDYLRSIDVESCGKSRILLNGLAEELHTRNLLALYQKWYGEDQ